MKSIGILIYGKLEFDEVVKMLDSVSINHGIDYTKYEIVIREADNESRQKYGYWTTQQISDYIRTLSPNIYDLFLDRADLSTLEDQRKEVLNYITSVNGLMIILMESNYKIPQDELDLINNTINIKLSV
jgi:hypothetical protein